jgi:flagellar basal-body rod modification protein FlgD
MTSPVSSAATIGYAPRTASTQSSDAGTGAGASSSATASGAPLLDPQAFLQLLVAQLKYQDPSNPVDTSSFMNQTAMLSQVQTMSSMSTTLNSLVSAQQAQAATGLIGKQITYLDTNGIRATGVVSSANLLASGATVQVGEVAVPLAGVLGVAAPSTP